MGSNSTAVQVKSLTCLGCGADVRGDLLGLGSVLRVLRKSRGRCPDCDQDRFDAVFVVERSSSEMIDGGTLPTLAAYAAFGLAGALIVGDGGSSGKSRNEFELSGLAGLLILEKMDLPPLETIDWILSIVKETVKANLGPGQGLCAHCGEIFITAAVGHTVEGYCSPLCRKKHRAALAAADGDPSLEPAVARSLDCPHCGRRVNVKPGGKCLYCGRPVES